MTLEIYSTYLSVIFKSATECLAEKHYVSQMGMIMFLITKYEYSIVYLLQSIDG